MCVCMYIYTPYITRGTWRYCPGAASATRSCGKWDSTLPANFQAKARWTFAKTADHRNGGLMGFYGILLDFLRIYPLLMTNIAYSYWKSPLKSWVFPFKIVILHSYVSHYQRVEHCWFIWISQYVKNDNWLVVEPYPSEKYEFVNWDDDCSQFRWKNKIHVPHHHEW